MKKYAVIVAGGTGSRMGKEIPKQFIELHGKAILQHTLEVFFAAYTDIHIVLVVHAAYVEKAITIARNTGHPGSIIIVPGADTRFGSVKAGLHRVPDDALVFVHDAVRCLITPDLIRRCHDAAVQFGNAVPAVAPVDTVRLLNGEGNALIDRETVQLVQTPQVFAASSLKYAYSVAAGDAFTDDATVAENAGQTIHLVPGEKLNIKVTHPPDLLLAEYVLAAR